MMNSVLFLCTGNTCRSIMAEAVARQRSGGKLQVYSAGVEPEGKVNPDALRILERYGVPAAGLFSKSIDSLMLVEPGLVVTVCDHAEQTCPASLAAESWLHRPIPDPSKASVQKREEAFETAYRSICALVDEALAQCAGPPAD
jgi:arsenate reductase (thioredoxin)